MNDTFAGRALAIAATALLAAGCATPINQPLTAEATQSVRTSKVVPSVKQSEIGAIIDVQNTGAVMAQFGIIGALIGAAVDSSVNASRTKSAEELLKDIRNDLIEFDFYSVYSARIDDSIRRGEVLSASKSEPTKSFNDQALTAIARTADEDAVLYLIGDYNFNASFSAIRTGIRALLIRSKDAREAGSRKLTVKDAIYRSTIVASVALPAPADEKAANAQRWAENESALVRQALVAGIEKSAKALVLDLSAPDYESASKRYNKQRKIDNVVSDAVAEIDEAMVYRRKTDGSIFVLAVVDASKELVAKQ
ncbi:hypothetical protein GYB61_03685 [bacterium]|nr:hypothetical protein [bacterium]